MMLKIIDIDNSPLQISLLPRHHHIFNQTQSVGLSEIKPDFSPLTIYSITHFPTPIRCYHPPLNVAIRI